MKLKKKRRCRCIKTINLTLKKDNIYYYNIINESEMDYLYPYYIYTDKINEYIATFSKEYFNKHFIDIQKERKKKLNKINESR